MSNRLAIAAVTATLQDRLAAVASAEVNGTQVLTARPDTKGKPDAGPTIHVFLYDVAVNPFVGNDRLPTRDRQGTLTSLPIASLDLRYLLTFSGRDAAQEPQRLLGATLADLNDRPVLTRDEIKSSTSARAHLADADLDQQPEPVVLSALHLDLEELSRLWSVLLQEQPYELSMQYQASMVMITPDVTAEPHPPPIEAHIDVLEPGVETIVVPVDAERPT